MPPISSDLSPDQLVEQYIQQSKVIIFSKSFCPFCKQVKELFKQLGVNYVALELDLIDNGAEVQTSLLARSGQKTVPNTYINGVHLGGASDTFAKHKAGELMPMLQVATHSYDYDMVVIGGGSGGLAASKEAAKFGAKVAVLDFVKPTPKGAQWGLGGTCVNVGCIPKKLMHQAAVLHHSIEDSKAFGWQTPDAISHNWATLVENVASHIGGLNWGYRVALRDKKVEYVNAYAKFTDAHTVHTVDKRGKERTITADKFLVATGGRPRYPDIPGAKEHCITSDDLFSLQHAPGKTLLVGASYIALECAGFLATLGYDVTVMVRSIFLRGFDQQMADKVAKYMGEHGVKFIHGAVPSSVEKVVEGEPGTLKVTAKTNEGEVITDEYNTVILAIGRDPCTSDLGLENTGITLAKSGKIVVDDHEKSSVDNIYAIGDVIERGLELTPVAIQAGKLLARRLYAASNKLMDYTNVCTTVFTPLEYGCCGLSEEDAIAKYGEADIEVYHTNFWPLEFTVAHRPENDCYAKLVCLKSESDKVVGLHVLSPNAGEITQGFGMALQMGATKEHFDNLVGIHPTCAETFTTLNVTKKSGEDPSASGC